jgi:DNA-binding NtrC family response regulator
MKTVLYVGCPHAERAEAERLLRAAKVGVVWADSAASALGELRRRDLPMLLDLSGGGQALRLARDVRAERPSTLILAVMVDHRPELTAEAVLVGVADVLPRPVSGERVAAVLEYETAFELRHAGQAVEVHPHTLYSQSPSMRGVVALVARAAAGRAGTIIRGEEGTGRQVTARAINAHASPQGPFVRVDCSVHEAMQLEAELFGVVSRPPVGEQTTDGPERVSRRSRLGEALGGTLYLQHLTEAAVRVQARLARVLRDREAVLVETGETVSVDVRPIAGVEPGFDRAVADGQIRDDLYRRLSAISIDLPPLRKRREDLPALANFLLRDLCSSIQAPPRVLTRTALSLISAMPWRGNAVELRNLLALVIAGPSTDRAIVLEDLLAHMWIGGGPVVMEGGGTLRQARARFEREYIAAVLEQHRGRISAAARTLGIQRTNLYRKMRLLRVDRTKNDTTLIRS